jgi:hypothetical protein
MASVARPDYETCKTCTHTKNIHTSDTGECRAYMCECSKYE